ncbi:MAG: TonB-dependent receptor [Bacteroidota bacterium]|nr:TonB-dependent receptor [Bacteroidota bacterium]
MKNVILTFIFLFFYNVLFCQKYIISGFIKDSLTAESLAGATIYDSLGKTGTVSNEYGFYSLTAKDNKVVLSISYVGYKKALSVLQLNASLNIDFYLSADGLLPEVEVIENNFNQPISVYKLPLQQLKKIPALGGETDLLKAISLLPGISVGTEGTANILIRGGGQDQTQILLDGANVYNATHLGGFLSVINPAAVSNLELYKSGFPARYGGRLSGVVDIYTKEGNKKDWHGEVGMGIITSKFLIEGPIIKNKSSLILSGRASYPTLIASYIQDKDYKKGFSGNSTNIGMYDLNAKFNYAIDSTSHLFLSFYTGRDNGAIQETYNKSSTLSRFITLDEVAWGNVTATLRYNKIISPKLFLKSFLAFSSYDYDFSGQEKDFKQNTSELNFTTISQSKSLIRDWSGKIQVDYIPSTNHFIKLGIELTNHFFKPEKLFTRQDKFATDSVGFSNPVSGQEWGLFVEDEITISPKLTTNVGLRWSGYAVGKKIYQGVEPRVALAWQLFQRLWLKTSYSNTRQYLHLLTSGGAGLPNDIWVSVTENVPPQTAQQLSLGITGELSKFKLKYEIEGFYKKMQQLVELQLDKGAFYSFEESWERTIEPNGRGTAYGLEFFIHKPFGKLNGFLSYTLSFSNRQFENINQGKVYPFMYDRRHNFSITANYQLARKWNISGTWLYQSGHAITLPVAVSNDYLIFTTLNNGRFPAYHRLDVNVEKIWSRKNRVHTLQFGAYNAYNRHNPFSISIYPILTVKPSGPNNEPVTTSTLKVVQTNLLPMIPSISYNLKF